MTDTASSQGQAQRDWISIGKLAEQAGVSTRTIRYYEELGIIPWPPRSAGNTRRYPREYRFYLDSIVALKDVGFDLSELVLVARLYLGTGQQPMTDAEREETQTTIEVKSEMLRRRLRVLERLEQLFDPSNDNVNAAPGQSSDSADNAGSGVGLPFVPRDFAEELMTAHGVADENATTS